MAADDTVTKISLEKYVDMRFEGSDRHFKARLDDMQHMLEERFKTQTERLVTDTAQLMKRLEGMNEIRKQLQMQSETFATREAVVLIERALKEKAELNLSRISTLENARANLEGRLIGLGAVVIIVEVVLRVFWK